MYIHAQKGQTTVVFSPLLCARRGRACVYTRVYIYMYMENTFIIRI